jgi:GDPmannose 4,6-dehydratase
LQQDEPEDYVVATGVPHSVRDWIQIAFDYLGLDWQRYIISDRKLFRPADVDCLLGDPRKAMAKLGWKPKVSFNELVKMMVDLDLRMTQKDDKIRK